MALQIRRGALTDLTTVGFIPAQGELIYTTNGTAGAGGNELFIGDGTTPGANALTLGSTLRVAPVRGISTVARGVQVGIVSLTADDIAAGSTNTYYSTNQVKIDAGAALVNGNAGNTGITFSYNAGTRVINATVSGSGGLASVQSDSNPALGGNLSLNSKTINGTGTISISGSITGTGLTIGNISIASDVLLTAKPAPVITNVDSDFQFSFGSNTNPQTIWQYANKNFAVHTGIVGTVDTAPNLVSRISRGSLASPLVLQSGDRTIKMFAQGYDGTNFVTSGAFGMQVDSTDPITTGFVPGTFGVVTIGTQGNQSLTFNSRGILSVPVLKVGSFTVSSQTAFTPTAGMIVLDGTTFKGYNGSAWVNLN